MKTMRLLIMFAVLLLAMPAWGQDTPLEEPAAEEPAADTEAAVSASQDFADPVEEETSSRQPPFQNGGMLGVGLVVGLKAGGGFGQVFSEFGISAVGELEIGYNLPFHDRNLGIYVTGAYSGPTVEGTTAEPDPRLPGDGIMSYSVTTHQAVVGLGLIYRIPIPVDIFRPYVSAGGRMHLMRSDITGSVGGEQFGENSETGMTFGAIGALGGEVYLGPGGLLLEVQFGWAPVEQYVLRGTNVGSLNVAIGYRLFL